MKDYTEEQAFKMHQFISWVLQNADYIAINSDWEKALRDNADEALGDLKPLKRGCDA